jgi:hypothetical protein
MKNVIVQAALDRLKDHLWGEAEYLVNNGQSSYSVEKTYNRLMSCAESRIRNRLKKRVA